MGGKNLILRLDTRVYLRISWNDKRLTRRLIFKTWRKSINLALFKPIKTSFAVSLHPSHWELFLLLEPVTVGLTAIDTWPVTCKDMKLINWFLLMNSLLQILPTMPCLVLYWTTFERFGTDSENIQSNPAGASQRNQRDTLLALCMGCFNGIRNHSCQYLGGMPSARNTINQMCGVHWHHASTCTTPFHKLDARPMHKIWNPFCCHQFFKNVVFLVHQKGKKMNQGQSKETSVFFLAFDQNCTFHQNLITSFNSKDTNHQKHTIVTLSH